MVALTNAPFRGMQNRQSEITAAVPNRVAEAQKYSDQLDGANILPKKPFQSANAGSSPGC